MLYGVSNLTLSAHTTVNKAVIVLSSGKLAKYSWFVTVTVAVLAALFVVNFAITVPSAALKSVVESCSILNSFGTW